jgi:hypothetical protein
MWSFCEVSGVICAAMWLFQEMIGLAESKIFTFLWQSRHLYDMQCIQLSTAKVHCPSEALLNRRGANFADQQGRSRYLLAHNLLLPAFGPSNNEQLRHGKATRQTH